MRHVALVIKLTVFPIMKHALGVRELKRTGLPDPPPKAVTVYDPPTIAGFGGLEVKLTACGIGATTVKL
jgi:hypothetical protein